MSAATTDSGTLVRQSQEGLCRLGTAWSAWNSRLASARKREKEKKKSWLGGGGGSSL